MTASREPITAASIREMRELAGLSQAGLARLVGVSAVTVNRWERGTRSPSNDSLELVAAALSGTPVEGGPGRLARHRSGRSVVLVTGDGTGILTDGTEAEPVTVVDLRSSLSPADKQVLSGLAGVTGGHAGQDAARLIASALMTAMSS